MAECGGILLRDGFQASSFSSISVECVFFFPGMDLFPLFIFSFFFLHAPRTPREFVLRELEAERVSGWFDSSANRGTQNIPRIGLASVCVFDSSIGGGLTLQVVCSSLSSSLCGWKSWKRLCTLLKTEGTSEHFKCEVERTKSKNH